MKIKITAPYLWLPVQKNEEEIRMHFYVSNSKVRELDICLGTPRCDFYVCLEVGEYIGQTMDIVANTSKEKLDNIFCYRERPQNVYPFRPKLHFSAPIGWNNDPNGLVYKDGIYHMYYQWNPFGVEWANMQWGHASSRDLFHWEYQKEALIPNEFGQVYSGCCVVDINNMLGYGKDTLLFYYTAAGGMNDWSGRLGNGFTQRLAYSTDGGKTLQLSDRFVMQGITRENRDPKILYYKKSGVYIMLLYLDESEFGIYRSEDLMHWKQTQILEVEGMWECPDMFELDVINEEDVKKWVFWSADGYYVVGEFDGYEFHIESKRREAYIGKLPYAAQTYTNVENRVVSIAWLRIQNDRGNYRGLMSIPTELSLKRVGDEYLICMNPARQLEELGQKRRKLSRSQRGFSISLKGRATRLDLTWYREESKKACLYLQNIIIFIDFKKGSLGFEQVSKNTAEVVGYFDRTQELSLSIIIDQEVIEFYGNDGTIYGALETDENVLGYKVICESDSDLKEVSYSQYIM